MIFQSFVLRGNEEKLVDMLRARQKILGQEQSEAIDDDYAFMKGQSMGKKTLKVYLDSEIFDRIY